MATEPPKPPLPWKSRLDKAVTTGSVSEIYALRFARAELKTLRNENATLRNQIAEADVEVQRLEQRLREADL